jgi:hypothetical protein
MVLNCIIKTKLKDRGHNVKIEKIRGKFQYNTFLI